MQSRSSTQLIHESLLDTENSTISVKPTTLWIHFQFVYTVLNTFLNTYYDTTTEVTEGLEIEKSFLNTNLTVAIAALMLSLYLSVCQAKAQWAQSEHYNRKNNSNDLDEEVTPYSNTERIKKNILAYSHYFAEVSNDAQPLILVTQLANLPSSNLFVRILPYLSVTLFSALGNVQELLNTLVAYDLHDGNTAKNWKYIQFSLNLLNTFLKTTYTIGTLATEKLKLTPSFLTIAWQGYAASLPLALFFAICESIAHLAESEHFVQANQDTQLSINDIEKALAPLAEKKLSKKQELVAAGHYFSDLVEGYEAPLVVANALKIQNLSPLASTPIYAAMGLYSLFGNIQEYKNTRNVLAEDTARRQLNR